MVERASVDESGSASKQPVFTDNPRTVRVELSPGERIEEHDHPGASIVFAVLEGEMDVVLDGETYDLSAGALLQFDGETTVTGEAYESTTALVVLAEKP